MQLATSFQCLFDLAEIIQDFSRGQHTEDLLVVDHPDLDIIFRYLFSPRKTHLQLDMRKYVRFYNPAGSSDERRAKERVEIKKNLSLESLLESENRRVNSILKLDIVVIALLQKGFGINLAN